MHQKYSAKVAIDVNTHTTNVVEDAQVKLKDAIDSKGSELKDAILAEGKETKEGLSKIEAEFAEVKQEIQFLVESAKKEMRRTKQSDIVPSCINLDDKFAESTAASTEATEELERYSLANMRKLKNLTFGRFKRTN
jgi:hypothetical protein